MINLLVWINIIIISILVIISVVYLFKESPSSLIIQIPDTTDTTDTTANRDKPIKVYNLYVTNSSHSLDKINPSGSASTINSLTIQSNTQCRKFINDIKNGEIDKIILNSLIWHIWVDNNSYNTVYYSRIIVPNNSLILPWQTVENDATYIQINNTNIVIWGFK